MNIMRIGEGFAAVDNDFIWHVSEINRNVEEISKMLADILRGLSLNGIIHPLVYDKEVIKDNPKVQDIFLKKIIEKIMFDDILQGEKEREDYYKIMFSELYRAHKGEEFPDGEDVFKYWKHKQSLGEIHSIVMCLLCNCGIFLSDDGDSKALKHIVEQRCFGSIDVYNRKEVLEQYQLSGGTMSRDERRAFTHINH